MLTPSYATVLLANAIESCYLPDSDGNIKRPLPYHFEPALIKSTIQKLTFTSNYTKEVFALLVDACEKDMDFDYFVQSIFFCPAISSDSYTHNAAYEYLKIIGWQQ